MKTGASGPSLLVAAIGGVNALSQPRAQPMPTMNSCLGPTASISNKSRASIAFGRASSKELDRKSSSGSRIWRTVVGVLLRRVLDTATGRQRSSRGSSLMCAMGLARRRFVLASLSLARMQQDKDGLHPREEELVTAISVKVRGGEGRANAANEIQCSCVGELTSRFTIDTIMHVKIQLCHIRRLSCQ